MVSKSQQDRSLVNGQWEDRLREWTWNRWERHGRRQTGWSHWPLSAPSITLTSVYPSTDSHLWTPCRSGLDVQDEPVLWWGRAERGSREETEKPLSAALGPLTCSGSGFTCLLPRGALPAGGASALKWQVPVSLEIRVSNILLRFSILVMVVVFQ